MAPSGYSIHILIVTSSQVDQCVSQNTLSKDQKFTHIDIGRESKVKLRTNNQKFGGTVTSADRVGDDKGRGNFGVIAKPSSQLRNAERSVNHNLFGGNGNGAPKAFSEKIFVVLSEKLCTVCHAQSTSRISNTRTFGEGGYQA